MASMVNFACKYSSSGCNLSLSGTEKTEHEDCCDFKPYSCPTPGSSCKGGCKWFGQLEQVMPHLMHSHRSITTLEGEDVVFLATDINCRSAVNWVMIQSCYSHHFIFVIEKQQTLDGHKLFFAVVQHIGSYKESDNFFYRLELNGHRRRLTWEATPRSIHEGVQSAINCGDCLVIDDRVVQLFADNGNLGVNVTISPV